MASKTFWEKMGLNQRYRAKRCKRLMYVGLKSYLDASILKLMLLNLQKKHSVTKETPRLNELRDRYKKQKLEAIFR